MLLLVSVYFHFFFCLIAKFLLSNYTTHNPEERSDLNPPIQLLLL